jgi:hypothetical protein
MIAMTIFDAAFFESFSNDPDGVQSKGSNPAIPPYKGLLEILKSGLKAVPLSTMMS